MEKIPKKIHYCWFGRGQMPDKAKECITSWKKYCPNYEIVEWNEDNFDINENQYVKEAYENRKYAFVTDYVRLYALYNYGGIYMDTDVEVVKELDHFLIHQAFSGFESNYFVPTGIMGAQKNNLWIKDLLDEYQNLSFYKENGELDLTTNVIRITKLTTEKYNLNLNGMFQDLKEVVFYPSDYFCPKSWETGIIKLTENTHAIHHFSGSWQTDQVKKENQKRLQMIEKYGEEIGLKKYYHKQKMILIITLPYRAIRKIYRISKNKMKIKKKS